MGFGIAGTCAAIEAHIAGASVTIFEVAASLGGTWVQKAAGFDDAVEDLRAYLMLSGGPGVDAARVDLYAENAVAHFK